MLHRLRKYAVNVAPFAACGAWLCGLHAEQELRMNASDARIRAYDDTRERHDAVAAVFKKCGDPGKRLDETLSTFESAAALVGKMCAKSDMVTKRSWMEDISNIIALQTGKQVAWNEISVRALVDSTRYTRGFMFTYHPKDTSSPVVLIAFADDDAPFKSIGAALSWWNHVVDTGCSELPWWLYGTRDSSTARRGIVALNKVLAEEVRAGLALEMAPYEGTKTCNVMLVGQGVGGALAVLNAMVVASSSLAQKVVVHTLGAPSVLSEEAKQDLEAMVLPRSGRGIQLMNIVHDKDPVPHMTTKFVPHAPHTFVGGGSPFGYWGIFNGRVKGLYHGSSLSPMNWRSLRFEQCASQSASKSRVAVTKET